MTSNKKSRSGGLITRMDVAAAVGQFLADVSVEEAIIELLQNEIDQKSRVTRLRFLKSKLVCEGNGKKVSENGWARLSFVLGAGSEAPVKRGGIGVKNHGLRACWKLGDKIEVLSDGLRSKLLATYGGSRKLKPAVSEVPEPCQRAPKKRGCRIEVTYRRSPLKSATGEHPPLPAVDDQQIEDLFLHTAEHIQSRFMGVMRPGFHGRWTVVLEHYRCGEITVDFQACAGGGMPPRGVRAYRRSCTIRRQNEDDLIIREQVRQFKVAVDKRLTGRIPDFYSASKGVLCELSWNTDERGRPTPTEGRLRYPIGYPDTNGGTGSGWGFHISAPFLSDQARKALSRGMDAWNKALVRGCEERFFDILRRELVPVWGPAATIFLRYPKDIRDDTISTETRQKVLEAAKQGALPVTPHPNPRKMPRHKVTRKGHRYRVPPIRNSSFADIVVPCASWAKGTVDNLLAQLIPDEALSIHPRVPPFVLATLVEAGHGEGFIVFDEDILKERQWVPEGADNFPWGSEAERRAEFSDLERVKLYLAFLYRWSQNEHDDDNWDSIDDDCLLPDLERQAQIWPQMRRVRTEPPTIPGVRLPPLLHTSLNRSKVLASGPIAVPWLDLAAVFEDLDTTGWSGVQRLRLFDWIVDNPESLGNSALKALSEHAIWPATSGELVAFKAFCIPDAVLEPILRRTLKTPSQQVLNLPGVKALPSPRRGITVRRQPQRTEVLAWYQERWSRVVEAGISSRARSMRLSRLESDLEKLLNHPQIKRVLAPENFQHQTLTAANTLRPVHELHQTETLGIKEVKLTPESLVRGRFAELYRILGARAAPSSLSLVQALRANPRGDHTLFTRLKALVNATPDPNKLLSEVPCMPVRGGSFVPPREVAIFTPEQDYWGEWKKRFPTGVALHDANRELLYRVGVFPPEPLFEHQSRGFFEWLACDPQQIKDHIVPIFNHFKHANGPKAWCQSHNAVPVFPVHHTRTLELWSLARLKNPRSKVFIDDFPELAQALFDADLTARMVLVRHGTRTILHVVRKLGITSIRASAGAPVNITPHEPLDRKLPRLEQCLKKLKSIERLNGLEARLDEFDIQPTALTNHWRSRIASINVIRWARSIEASYKVAGRVLTIESQGGLDARDGTLWLKAETEDPQLAFFGVVADMVFKNPNKTKTVNLSYAVMGPWTHTTSLQLELPAPPPTPPDRDKPAPPAQPSPRRRLHSTPHDTAAQHIPSPDILSRSAQAPNRRTPSEKAPGKNSSEKPGNRTSSTQSRPKSSVKRPPTRRPRSLRRKGSGRSRDALEEEHIQDLKDDHYAHHCQACLGSHDSSALSPSGSYTTHIKNRQKIVEAHHPHPVVDDGARNASNLLILCAHHHGLLGDKLPHKDISHRLKTSPEACQRLFFSPNGEHGTTDGVVIGLPVKDMTVRLFFTREHAEFWLDPQLDS